MMKQQGGRGIHAQYSYKPDRSLWCWEKEKKSKKEQFFFKDILSETTHARLAALEKSNAVRLFSCPGYCGNMQVYWWLTQAVDKEKMHDPGKPIEETLTVKIKH